jgi:hypothetical protein
LSSITERAVEWALGRDTGLSSKALCAFMLGISQDSYQPPLDASDRGRCIRLLELIPEWIPRLDELAALKPVIYIMLTPDGTEERSDGWPLQVALIRAEMGGVLSGHL